MKKYIHLYLMILICCALGVLHLFSVPTVLAHSTTAKSYEVEHIFTHCLLVDAKTAFDKDNFMSEYYDNDCLTTSEFKNVLEELYDNNYMLVDINDTFKVKDGVAKKQQIILPNEKKPLVLSIDDVNYDHKKTHRGMAEKIVVDENGRLASMIDGKIDYEREFVSILDNFIKKHPDFSFKGAKATLCLTGYDGILGYRTQTGDKEEIVNARHVVEVLKENGYNFACHSYGHYHMKKISDSAFTREMECWKREVEPIIGSTKIYVYPYGENEILKGKEVSAKHKLLLNYGFKLFCGVGEKHFYSRYPFNTSTENQVLFMDRRPLDGISLRANAKIYSQFFNCKTVYDHENRRITYE